MTTRWHDQQAEEYRRGEQFKKDRMKQDDREKYEKLQQLYSKRSVLGRELYEIEQEIKLLED